MAISVNVYGSDDCGEKIFYRDAVLKTIRYDE